MKLWIAFCCLLLATQAEFNHLHHGQNLPPQNTPSGRAFVTQSSPGSFAHDYDINFGESWQSVRIFRLLEPLGNPLKVYVASPHNAAIYKESYRSYVAESLRMWNEALDGRLNYSYTKNRNEADITLDWVPAFQDKYVAGLTTYRVGHASIEIKTVGIPEADIKGNIIHEVGHALGISGHSNASGDIMVGTRKWQRTDTAYNPKLSQRDIRAIQRLYSLTWKKGEDLYATQAQSAPLPAVASTQKNLPNITLKPLDDTDLVRWNEAQTRETQAKTDQPETLRARFTQIFPKTGLQPNKR
ncbi:matrixin family metalloprotease [Vampirovibrio sp.]|uniref:matrixin family metalloprotease n=1 Tax=Vampirovibrio sp. TaxID=2717857 RepID=UPI003593C2F4